MKWVIQAQWLQQARTFRVEAPTIEIAIAKTREEAAILWGCRQPMIIITDAYMFHRVRV